MEGLANQTHAKVIELAQRDLHSTREKYLEGLTFFQESPNVFVVNLSAKVMWIEDGMEEHDMLDSLLKSPKAKQGKNGRYITIPFEHNVKPSSQTSYQTDLTHAIRVELKNRKLPKLGSIEKGVDGQPTMGVLHRFNIMNQPLHKGPNQFSPGQGSGAIGKVRQGPTGIPHLQGVQIAQHKLPSGRVVKTATTFRTASDSQRGQNRWIHPGFEGKKLLDKAYVWALEEYRGTILPQLLQSIKEDYA